MRPNPTGRALRGAHAPLEFEDDDLDGIGSPVHVPVKFARRVGVEPVGLPVLPVHGLFLALLGHYVEGSAPERHDRAAVFVPVHGERLVRVDERLPDLEMFVFELRLAAGTLLLPAGEAGPGGEPDQEAEGKDEKQAQHGIPPGRQLG